MCRQRSHEKWCRLFMMFTIPSKQHCRCIFIAINMSPLSPSKLRSDLTSAQWIIVIAARPLCVAAM